MVGEGGSVPTAVPKAALAAARRGMVGEPIRHFVQHVGRYAERGAFDHRGQTAQHLVDTDRRGVESPEIADRRVFDARSLVEKQVEANGNRDEHDADRRETEPRRRRAVRFPRIPGRLRRVGHQYLRVG